ncbi:MAG: hypothetical protein RBQ99_01780 [Trichlorobacter sp.]|nr:hypothetical protein [Trichlorobacter sp.]
MIFITVVIFFIHQITKEDEEEERETRVKQRKTKKAGGEVIVIRRADIRPIRKKKPGYIQGRVEDMPIPDTRQNK